jgi:hypothetical protein
MPAHPSQYSALTWRKSRASTSDTGCVEIAGGGQSVIMRDSRDARGPMLAFPASQWSAFLRRLKSGERPTQADSG